MRLLTKTVPLSPSRSERAFGTPLMNTSILNPFGSLSCVTGNLSAAIGKGGGLIPRSLMAASRREFCSAGMGGSKMAPRIGRGGVAGERKGLAAAAAEIELSTRAARARLLHPRRAAEGIEGRRVRPDIGERMLAHVPEFKAGNRLGRMAGQHLARWRHVERAPAPAADAGLGIAGIVVRHHRVDDDAAVVARAQVLHRRHGTLDLLAARHQCGAGLDPPAVVFHLRDLDTTRAARDRQIDPVADP